MMWVSQIAVHGGLSVLARCGTRFDVGRFDAYIQIALALNGMQYGLKVLEVRFG